MSVTFKQVKPPKLKQMDRALYDGGKQVLAAEVKRIARDRYRPLVRRWQKQNRPKYRTSTKIQAKIVTAKIIEESGDKPIAKWVHRTGTKAHVIRATKPHGLLVFERGGSTVFTRRAVNHPGFSSTGEHDRIEREEPPKIQSALEIIIGGKFVTIK